MTNYIEKRVEGIRMMAGVGFSGLDRKTLVDSIEFLLSYIALGRTPPAASGQQESDPAPAALTDDEIIAQWLEFDTWPRKHGETVIKFARALLSASK